MRPCFLDRDIGDQELNCARIRFQNGTHPLTKHGTDQNVGINCQHQPLRPLRLALLKSSIKSSSVTPAASIIASSFGVH
jgi:hypothetical protein